MAAHLQQHLHIPEEELTVLPTRPSYKEMNDDRRTILRPRRLPRPLLRPPPRPPRWHAGLDAELIGTAQNKGWDLSDPVKAFAAATGALWPVPAKADRCPT